MINYDEIDEKCRDLVRYFNNVGLITKFSCQGHNRLLDHQYEIIFDECVSDDVIKEFLRSISQGRTHTPLAGRFLKWSRWYNGDIIENWVYVVALDNCYENQKLAIQDMETMKKIIKGD